MRLTRGNLQQLEDAVHESHLLGVKCIGYMLGMVTLFAASVIAIHHLPCTLISAIQHRNDVSASGYVSAFVLLVQFKMGSCASKPSG